jgi:hypothetical protein
VQCFELHLRQVRLLVGHRENVLGVLDRGKRTDFEARSEKNVFLLPVASASAAERNRRAVPACEITAVTITLRMQARQHFLARHTATRPPTRTLPLAGKTDMLHQPLHHADQQAQTEDETTRHHCAAASQHLGGKGAHSGKERCRRILRNKQRPRIVHWLQR